MHPPASSDAGGLARTAYAKITRRIAPLLFICYMLNYLDRVNIGFAQLQMKSLLGFSDTVYGLGAATFFIGYFIFEVPSNMLLHKIGARKTMLRIMFMWGLVSACTMFVTTPLQFYIARFLLGAFEAGFFPGMMLYLTYWYAPARRARVVSLFLVGTVFAGIVGGPVSGWIMQNMEGVHGWHAWQWLFVLEGLPSSLLGIVVYLSLVDSPADARWLSEAEKQLVISEVAAAERALALTNPRSTGQAFRDPKVYLLGFVLFSVLCAAYALSFWMPAVIRDLGVTNMQHIGLYSAVPAVAGAVAMIAYGWHSDKHVERRWHFASAAFVGAMALCATTIAHHSLGLSMVLFTVANAGIVATLPIFWALSSSELSARSSVAGLAIISSLSALAGVFSPFVLGLIKTATGSLTNGIYVLTALMVIGAIAIIWGTTARQRLAVAVEANVA